MNAFEDMIGSRADGIKQFVLSQVSVERTSTSVIGRVDVLATVILL